MPFDITLAGSYTRVGNLTKDKTTSVKPIATMGKSVAEFLKEMLSETVLPSKTNPSVSFNSVTSGAYEVGDEILPSWNAKFNAGSYTYDTSTGVSVEKWTIENNTTDETSSDASGNFEKIIVGDDTSYTITATATHTAGNKAKDNFGEYSSVQIDAGDKSKTSIPITGYRPWFIYVGEDCTTTIDSDFIRHDDSKYKIGNSNGVSNRTISIPQGTKRVMIAIPKGVKQLYSVIDIDGMKFDLIELEVFNKIPIEVEVKGLNGYTPTATYNIWKVEKPEGLRKTQYELYFK